MNRFSIIVVAILAMLTVFACTRKETPVPDPTAMQPLNLPQGMQAEVSDVDVSYLDTLSGFAELPEVEQEIFRRTVRIQSVFYDKLHRWAEQANTVKSGRDASTAIRHYIAHQDDFATQMKRLDDEFIGKISPNYAETPQFERVLDAYMEDASLQQRTEFIMSSYISLLQRFQDDPAFQDILAELEQLSR
jgi:hypothetical protein